MYLALIHAPSAIQDRTDRTGTKGQERKDERMPPERILDDHGELTCLCGNTSMDSGFNASTSTGWEVEPTPKDWDSRHWVCEGCGRIIDQETLAIVGTRKQRAPTYVALTTDDGGANPRVVLVGLSGEKPEVVEAFAREIICRDERSAARRIPIASQLTHLVMLSLAMVKRRHAKELRAFFAR